MAILDDVLKAIERQPATETHCVQGTCHWSNVWMAVSDGAPTTEGTYAYDVAVHVGNGPTMSESCDRPLVLLQFLARFAPLGTIVNSNAWEIATVRHYF